MMKGAMKELVAELLLQDQIQPPHPLRDEDHETSACVVLDAILTTLNLDGCSNGEGKELQENDILIELASKLVCLFRKKDYNSIIEECVSNAPDKHGLTQLVVAIASLQLFVQLNWLHYDAALVEKLSHNDLISKYAEALGLKNFEDLRVDGLDINDCFALNQFLQLAICLFARSEKSLSVNPWLEYLHLVWKLRSLVVHQLVLEDSSFSLYKSIKECIESIELKSFRLLEGANNSSILGIRRWIIQFKTEFAAAFLQYHDVNSAKVHLKSIENLVSTDMKSHGELGIRTKFQQNPIPQLVAKLIENEEDEQMKKWLSIDERRRVADCVENENNSLLDCKLDDDTLLPKVKLLSEPKSPISTASSLILYPEEEVFLLEKFKMLQVHGPYGDELHDEELLAYLETLLSHSNLWLVKLTLLTTRSLLEKESVRKLERSMSQLEHMVNLLRAEGETSPGRSLLFYSILPPSISRLEKSLADILLATGASKSALDIYLRLKDWDSVIKAYFSIGRKDKAEDQVRKLLEERRTPHLLCLLGDATDSLEAYEEAWSLSEHKYARAKKSIGSYHFSRKNYEESIEPFQASLQVNSLQPSVWFSLGYAALVTEKFDIAASAYRRSLELDSDSFEAWNNLAKAYIKMKDKPRAWRALHEALKCRWDEYRIWENYLVVSIDVGAADEVVKSWHRLIDLKRQYHDDEVASILVKIFEDENLPLEGQSREKLGPQIRELFGRIAATSGSSSSRQFWSLYARLLIILSARNPQSDLETEAQKVFSCLQKSCAHVTQDRKWTQNESTVTGTVSHLDELLNLCQRCREVYGSSICTSAFPSFQLSFTNALASVRQAISGWINMDVIQRLNESIDAVEKKFKDFQFQ